jgi:urease accessory protein
LGHVLGNHHYPITIVKQKIYLQPGADLAVDLAVVEQTIKQLKIPGLIINYEMRSQSLEGVQSPDFSLDFTSSFHHHH